MNIGPPKRIIEIDPIVLPLPVAEPIPEPEPVSEPVPAEPVH